jgi:outer membrane protein OmpA-like peptidoglycan-associated protein
MKTSVSSLVSSLVPYVTQSAARSPRAVVTLALLVALPLVPVTGGAQGIEQFTARSARLSDSVIAGDLSRFDSLMRVAPNPRSVALVGLARDAYERNDNGVLTARLLAMSVTTRSDAEARGRRPELWALLDSMQVRRGLNTAARENAIALEVALLRAGSPLLGAPSCAQWETAALRIAEQLRAIPVPTPPVAPTPIVAAVPVVAPVTAPATLHAVPSRVHFALDKSALAPASRRVLDALSDSLSHYIGVRIELEGHTDPRGSVAYNVALSQRRVQAVRDYLLHKGLDAARISTSALGKSKLERQETDIASHARNRRVMFRFYDPQGREIPTLGQLDDLQVERR